VSDYDAQLFAKSSPMLSNKKPTATDGASIAIFFGLLEYVGESENDPGLGNIVNGSVAWRVINIQVTPTAK
jgi:hypothetical protein